MSLLFDPQVQFFDAVSLKKLPSNWRRDRALGTGFYVRASADGRSFAMRDGVGGEPHSMLRLALAEDESKIVETGGAGTSVLIPGPDGKVLYGGDALYNDRLEPTFPNPRPQSFAKPFVPAADGSPYFLRLDYTEGDQVGGKVAVFRAGANTPLGDAGPFAGVTNEQISFGDNRDTLTHDRRIIFLPKAKVIISIAKGNDRLVLHRFDPEARK